MKKQFLCITILLILVITTQSQGQPSAPDPEAPEKWSKPEEIEMISSWEGSIDGLSVSADGKTLYISSSGISVTKLINDQWTEPKKLGKHINREEFVKSPAIAPSGKRLFYIWLNEYDNYDFGTLFYSDWDDDKNDWGEPVECGPGVSQLEYIKGLTAPDDTTIIFTECCIIIDSFFDDLSAQTNTDLSGGYFINKGYYDKNAKQYNRVEPLFDYVYLASSDGITSAKNQSKFYFLMQRPTRDKTGNATFKEDIIVIYKNKITNKYSMPYVLNISYQADTLYFNGEYLDRYQGYPTITADGKTLFFVAGYHGKETIYVSHLLVEGNIDSVTSVKEGYSEILPTNFELYPNYPNPFNPATTIKYTIPAYSKVSLKVYDLLGREIKTIVDEEKAPGSYNIVFNAEGLASGVFICKLHVGSYSKSRKLILLK